MKLSSLTDAFDTVREDAISWAGHLARRADDGCGMRRKRGHEPNAGPDGPGRFSGPELPLHRPRASAAWAVCAERKAQWRAGMARPNGVEDPPWRCHRKM